MSTRYRALVLLAHPSLQHSRINRAMRDAICGLENITLHDLYHEYPEFYIDVKREQQLLLRHDLVVFQSPFYWYSTTPMLKLWQDVVLEYGFAYGTGGTQLRGKDFWPVFSTGGPDDAYAKHGYNRYTVDQLLLPLHATNNLCGMVYHAPLLIQGSYQRSDEEIARHAAQYRALLADYTARGGSALPADPY